jgi:hypothetical protein
VARGVGLFGERNAWFYFLLFSFFISLILLKVAASKKISHVFVFGIVL